MEWLFILASVAASFIVVIFFILIVPYDQFIIVTLVITHILLYLYCLQLKRTKETNVKKPATFLGWCLVWKLYLSKFKLVRELISQKPPEVNISNKTQKTL